MVKRHIVTQPSDEIDWRVQCENDGESLFSNSTTPSAADISFFRKLLPADWDGEITGADR